MAVAAGGQNYFSVRRVARKPLPNAYVGHLRRVYKVITPSGVLADGEFETPTEIPPRLPDRFEQYFDTSEADILPVFKKVA